MRQLFEAVEFIHRHNIVHRDLKVGFSLPSRLFED